MRDQVSHDDDNIDDDLDSQEDDSDYQMASSSSRRVPTTIISGGLDSALPATASWGKSSAPSTPKSVNRTLTPDAFGPPLSVAVASASQQQQKQPLSPNALKRKLEKKKRKELLKQKKEEEERQRLQQEVLDKQQKLITKQQKQQVAEEEEEDEEEEEEVKQEEAKAKQHEVTSSSEDDEEEPAEARDPLTCFVLGSTFQDVCTPKYEQDQDELPVGILGLNNKEQPVLTAGTSVLESELQKLNLNDMSPLEYLSQNTPTPVYSGSFNPFSHNMLRNNVQNDSPASRKHSRFGFAQF
jgi:flagellar biosynthesis GTPase FlhF